MCEKLKNFKCRSKIGMKIKKKRKKRAMPPEVILPL